MFPISDKWGEGKDRAPIMFSKNLGNSSHYDYKDKSQSISFWAEKYPGTAHNWFFVLPNLSINSSAGVVIKLEHGIAIVWDGTIHHHCTSATDGVGNGDEDNQVYRCMFSVVSYI